MLPDVDPPLPVPAALALLPPAAVLLEHVPPDPPVTTKEAPPVLALDELALPLPPPLRVRSRGSR